MIKYDKDAQQTIPTSEIRIIGLGGAGSNIIDRVILDGLKGPAVLAVNADQRTLFQSTAKDKIQLGAHITRGLGCGGDPELGIRSAKEAENEIRASIKGYKIVFLCVGLGGGTGSGAAPLISRIAKEEGAFTVVFATMPFSFEGTRRRAQAETSLNELATLADALVTFDNGRMSNLVPAEEGIHKAFDETNILISNSIHAVSRIALNPGIIHIGLDDLVSSLSSNRSRCLFGSGVASKQDRVYKALEKALNSPLLDKGKLLKTADTVLVHICGGPTMTIFESQLMMEELNKNLNPNAQIFFGVSIDDSLGDQLSVTIISSLPEERVELNTVSSTNLVKDQPDVPPIGTPKRAPLTQSTEPVVESAPRPQLPPVVAEPAPAVSAHQVSKEELLKEPAAIPFSPPPPLEGPTTTYREQATSQAPAANVEVPVHTPPAPVAEIKSPPRVPETPSISNRDQASQITTPDAIPEPAAEESPVVSPATTQPAELPQPSFGPESSIIPEPVEQPQLSNQEQSWGEDSPEDNVETSGSSVRRRFAHLFKKQEPQTNLEDEIVEPSALDEDPRIDVEVKEKSRRWFDLIDNQAEIETSPTVAPAIQEEPVLQSAPVDDLPDLPEQVPFSSEPSQTRNRIVENPKRPVFSEPQPEPQPEIRPQPIEAPVHKEEAPPQANPVVSETEELSMEELLAPRQGMQTKSEKPKLEPEGDLFSGNFGQQGELQLEGKPKGRFEGESPNIYEGEDLDIPTFLREMN